ncbi:50S ribosomal protein L32 [Candidatus Daviesbacteria bacterium]|nr:50S ribosomal protein L32 [Candidatus Daviesbacteria bacterium]
MPHEPKKRHSKSAKRIRRGSISLKAANIIICANCNAKTLAHMACRSCGFYSGKAVTNSKQQVTVTKT